MKYQYIIRRHKNMLIDTNNTKTNKSQSKISIFYKFKNVKFIKNILFVLEEVKSIRIGIYREYNNTNNSNKYKHINFEDCFENSYKIQNPQSTNFCTKQVSMSVIKLNSRFRKIAGYLVENPENCVTKKSSKQNLDKKYILFANFLIENSINNLLPKNEIIKSEFGIKDWEIRKLKNELVEKGLLEKINKTTYVINKNNEIYTNYKGEIQ
jgi:hypothetical protein